jgi:hypothetical protein
MMLRILMVLMALSGSLTPNLFAGTSRADLLLVDIGGLPGLPGATGLPGPVIPGAPGILDTADFFALVTPVDGLGAPIPVAGGEDVPFPFDGPISGAISRLSATSFLLPEVGIYKVEFQVPVAELGQLVVTLNGAELGYTVVGRDAPLSQIVGEVLVQTTAANSVLTIRNPAGNAGITIVSVTGLLNPTSAHLVITRVR